jgi:hypothetical protein
LANDLTGEFDVVVQFSVPAVDRLLAAMHGIKRFPHSVSLRIDDRPRRVLPTAVEIIDLAGDSVVDPRRIRDLPLDAAPAAPRFDRVVNVGDLSLDLPPLVPSRLHGRAQVQLAPPALEIVDAAASRIKVRIPVRARYLADANTPALSQFATGTLVMTTAVSQIASQAGNVIDIDLRSHAVDAVFEPAWSSTPLAAADLAAINRFIANTLRSSVLPSNTTLPAGIEAMVFKTFTAPAPAVAALLNLTAAGGSPASVHRVILGGADFAFAVGIDALRTAFQPALDEIVSTVIPPFEVSITGPNPTYTVVVQSAEMRLRAGEIALVIKGRATTPAWYAPNFDFTVTQEFTLQPNGTTAELVVGSMSLDTSSWIVNQFSGGALDRFRPIRDRALARSDAAGKVRRMLDTQRLMGGLLRSLLTPARPDGQPQPPTLGATLAYHSAEIEADGLVLRGALTVADWGPPHVEFQEIEPVNSGPLPGPAVVGKEYSAFKSWIAGGVIDTFEWKRAFDTTPGFRDTHRFVKLPELPGTVATEAAFDLPAPGQVAGYRPMCVTITGRRLSAAGPIGSQPVTASYCAFHWFPLFDVALVDSASAPMAALTRPGANGAIEVVGYAPSEREDKARATPNLVVHFGNADTASRLQHVVAAVAKVARADSPTAIVAVLDAGALSSARHIDGVIYAESDERWAKLWGLHADRRPLTAVIDANGKAVWQHSGDVDLDTLIDVLRKTLRPIHFAGASTVLPGVRIGQTPPNFVFSYAPGHELTLRKLIGRPVVLVFTPPRADAGDTARPPVAKIARLPQWEQAVVLEIGDDVPDPTRAIAKAYGIAAWPTTIHIDTQGIVRDVRHGHLDSAAAKG